MAWAVVKRPGWAARSPAAIVVLLGGLSAAVGALASAAMPDGQSTTPRPATRPTTQGAEDQVQTPLAAARELARNLPCVGKFFDVQGRPAFLFLPVKNADLQTIPWVWYAPTLAPYPDASHAWMFRRFLEQGIAIAGVDVGESFGNPQGRAIYTALYDQLRRDYGLAERACLLPQSRGGLMLYNWAAENPRRVACIAGIYTVCDLRSYPGLAKACGAYGMDEATLAAHLAEHNPIDRLRPLAEAGVPILHIHGDNDKVVPLEKNSGELAARYRALGGPMRLIVVPGKGHQVAPEFFQCQELVHFVIAEARGATTRPVRPSASSQPSASPAPRVTVVEGGESKARPENCGAILVGPGINQPDPFPGYGGFVGWESPVRLSSGDWLVGFNAGYWHASPPTPLRYPAKMLEEYLKLGLPAGIVAPTGGRAMIIRSKDQGKTWSRPETLIDTPADDRHPAFVELNDGTVLCSFFSYMGEPEDGEWKDPSLAVRVHLIRSFDGGRTWEKDPILLRTPFTYDETDGPLVKLKDGSVLIAINGRSRAGPPDQAAVLRSTDRGQTWTLLGTVHAAHDLQEVTVAELPGGEWVMMARPEGDICWSRDQGRTWTAPVSFGMRMFAPSLYVLRDGTLLCLHGSYGRGGLRVIFSRDGGRTWIAPAKDYGFLVDQAYGYGKAMELPDGSLFVTYLATGGHRTSDAQTNAIRCIRLRVRPDYSGIDLLPAPNR